MMNSSEKDVNEILASVINENPMIFEVDGLELLVNPDILNFKDELCVAINPYVLYFYEELSKKVDLTYGLLLGLTKRFFEFSLKRIVGLYKYGDIEKIKGLMNDATPEALNSAVSSIQDNASVYITYRNLKKVIDSKII